MIKNKKFKKSFLLFFLFIFTQKAYVKKTTVTIAQTIETTEEISSLDDSKNGVPAKTYEASGRFQSPINLKGAMEVDLRSIKFNYKSKNFSITHTGHSTHLSPKKGLCFIIIDGIQYNLIQFHFHTPSEHLLEGQRFPLELHFVHKNKNGNIAVIGVLIKNGAHHKEFDQIITTIPQEINIEIMLKKPLDLMKLFPKDKHIYRYEGSLTTPPYAEGIKWLVMKKQIELSEDQINRIGRIMGKNSRDIQPTNGRHIVVDTTIEQ